MTLNWSSQYAPVDGDFSDVSLLLLGEGTNGSTTITDSSSNNLSVSVNGDAQISTAVNTPFGTGDGVLAFDGNGDALTIPTSSNFDFGTGDFTVELWYYPVATGQAYGRLFQTRDGDLYSAISICQNLSDPTNLTVTIDEDGAQASGFTLHLTTTSSPVTVGVWNYITLVRSGTTFTVYVNGRSELTGTSSASLYYNSSDTVIIGGQTVGISRSINGYISNLRITKGVARYTENFDVPTAPFPILSPSTRIEVGDGFDVEAANYILAVEAADTAAGQSGGLEPAVRTAINTFVVGCKSDGIWNAVKSSCIMAGARTLDGALVPLKGTAPTNFNFVAGDYDRKTGLVGDGSTKYLDSNRNNNADPQDSRHMAVWRTTSETRDAIRFTIASVNGTGMSQLATTTTLRIFRSAGADFQIVEATAIAGFWGHTRNAPNNLIGRYAGNTYISSLSSQSPLVSDNLQIYARSGGRCSNARLAFYSIGESLDLALLDTRVGNLMTAIGAAIP